MVEAGHRALHTPLCPSIAYFLEEGGVEVFCQILEAIHETWTRPRNEVDINGKDLVMLHGGNDAPASAGGDLFWIDAIGQDDHLWVIFDHHLIAYLGIPGAAAVVRKDIDGPSFLEQVVFFRTAAHRIRRAWRAVIFLQIDAGVLRLPGHLVFYRVDALLQAGDDLLSFLLGQCERANDGDVA